MPIPWSRFETLEDATEGEAKLAAEVVGFLLRNVHSAYSAEEIAGALDRSPIKVKLILIRTTGIWSQTNWVTNLLLRRIYDWLGEPEWDSHTPSPLVGECDREGQAWYTVNP